MVHLLTRFTCAVDIENDSRDTPILDIRCQMIYIRAIKQNHNTRGQDASHKREVAETIAAHVAQTTGTHCETFTNNVAAVILHHTQVIARITPLFSVIAVAPIGGTFAGEVTEIPLEARTIDGVREIANALDEATSHVLSAAMHH